MAAPAQIKTADKKHEIRLEDRERLAVSGVSEVISVSESYVALMTSEGRMYIKGAELSLGMLNVETGELTLEGRVNLIEYHDRKKKKNSASSKLFG